MEELELQDGLLQGRHLVKTAVCSQWGTHPHELVPTHFTEGGIGEMTLTQYNPPKVVTFDICKKCVRDEGFETDERFRWKVHP